MKLLLMMVALAVFRVAMCEILNIEIRGAFWNKVWWYVIRDVSTTAAMYYIYLVNKNRARPRS